MATLGTTLFSLTPLWQAGGDAEDVLELVARHDCGPAVEVIGHQTWRGFPHLSAGDERRFRDAVDRLGLVPAALGVYADRHRRPGRLSTDDETVAEVGDQLAVAARLGFPLARMSPMVGGHLLRRLADEAEQAGVVLTFEVQGVAPPAAYDEILALREQTPYVGLTLDFSLTVPALPAVFATALRERGLDEDSIDAVHRAWAEDLPVGQRIQTALDAVGPHSSPRLTHLVAGMFLRTGRQDPRDWAEVLPAVLHAHAKVWDTDVESVRAPHGAWIEALVGAGYDGAIVSEWGGHEMVAPGQADALAVTTAHVAMLRELLSGGRLVEVPLSWYRSIPLSCLESVEVTSNGSPANVPFVSLPGFSGSLAEAAASEEQWDVRDPLRIRVDTPAPVSVEVAVRIPYLEQAPGVPLVHRISVVESA